MKPVGRWRYYLGWCSGDRYTPFRMFRGRSGYDRMPYPPKEYNNKNKCE